MQVLVVEDEVRLAETLAQLLREQRYMVDVVYSGTDGLSYAESGQYDVIVLDVMLPGIDGYEVARTLRRKKNATPILMLRGGRLHDQALRPGGAAGPGAGPHPTAGGGGAGGAGVL